MSDGDQAPGSAIKRILRDKLAVNRAVGYMLITRGWQFFSAPVTIYLIYKFFGEDLQGYYYLFQSLLAAQIFFELGLNHILSLLASHEWSHLKFNEAGEVTGEQRALERLSTISRFGDRWYRLMILLFLPGLIFGGLIVIQNPDQPTSFWKFPWVAAVVLNAISLTYQPRLAVLEGCNQVATVNFVRMFQAVIGSLVVWAAILSGWGIWTVAAANFVRLSWEVYLVNVRYRTMFKSLKSNSETDRFSWKDEAWPLQWRLAIQSIGGYFSSYFFIPVIDQFYGKAAAGRMGMTWSIVSNLQAASLSWVQTRMPEFGMLVAKRKIAELEQKMLRIGAISVSLFLSAGGAFVAGVWLLTYFNSDAANRFLTPGQIGFLVLATLFLQVSWVMHSYVRLFKKDPFLLQNVISASITGVSAVYFGRHYGVTGIVVSYFLISICYTIPVSSWLLLTHRKTIKPHDDTHTEHHPE